MTSFEQALSAPSLCFVRLKDMKPLLHNGRVVVRRTHLAIETEILWNERHYLLFLPFHTEDLRHIEQLEIETREHSRGPLIENSILYRELTLIDALGRREQFDIILQEIYCDSMTLDKAVMHYKAEELTYAVEHMKSRLDAVGFQHKNLRPTNILICKSGVARPLRYWYAEWRDFANNDISVALSLIEQNRYVGTQPLHHSGIMEEEDSHPREYGGITRLCRGGYYGFIDNDGRQVTPFIYISASDFHEGRAVVGKNHKMGAIDYNGAKVIPVIYNHLEFDVETGTFFAIRDKYQYLIDYNGNIIRRTERALAIASAEQKE